MPLNYKSLSCWKVNLICLNSIAELSSSGEDKLILQDYNSLDSSFIYIKQSNNNHLDEMVKKNKHSSFTCVLKHLCTQTHRHKIYTANLVRNISFKVALFKNTDKVFNNSLSLVFLSL